MAAKTKMHDIIVSTFVESRKREIHCISTTHKPADNIDLSSLEMPLWNQERRQVFREVSCIVHRQPFLKKAGPSESRLASDNLRSHSGLGSTLAGRDDLLG